MYTESANYMTYAARIGIFLSIVLSAAVLAVLPAYAQLQGEVREFNRPDQQESEINQEPAAEEATTTSRELEGEVQTFNEPELFINEAADEVSEPVTFPARNDDEAREDEEQVERQRERVKERGRVDSTFLQDSDGDGIVNYDELNIYGTDPNDPNTGGGPYTDGEDIRRGLNPLASTTRAVVYDDPREEGAGEIADTYTVEDIAAETERTPDGRERVRAIEVRGKAQPKAFVTVYIFSRPIVVTVQADEEGEWRYRLEKDLEDGTHEVYVTSVNNSGRILLKSNSVSFTKEAEAVRLNSLAAAEVVAEEETWFDFFFDNLFWVTAVVIILALGVAVLLSGISWNEETASDVNEEDNPNAGDTFARDTMSSSEKHPTPPSDTSSDKPRSHP